MEWEVTSERSLYKDRWLDVRSADVKLPDGRHLDHRLIRMPSSAGAVVINSNLQALLIWRHRFITGRWGWEIPMGIIHADEDPAEAAAREVQEETGWKPLEMRPLLYGQPAAGIMDLAHYVFVSENAVKASPPSDSFESSRIEWIPLADVPELITKQQIVNYAAMASLLLAYTRFQGGT
jgi:8-oxo-dGTP pyrophosphatase MutT (NUDIX family)